MDYVKPREALGFRCLYRRRYKPITSEMQATLLYEINCRGFCKAMNSCWNVAAENKWIVHDVSLSVHSDCLAGVFYFAPFQSELSASQPTKVINLIMVSASYEWVLSHTETGFWFHPAAQRNIQNPLSVNCILITGLLTFCYGHILRVILGF